MKIYQFNRNMGKEITRFDSNFVMSRIGIIDKKAHIGFMYLNKEGIVGYHQAVSDQLLLVVSGSGTVRGENDEIQYVEAGHAVFWNKGEWHETVSNDGLTAVVIESEELDPSAYMKLRK
ncbi:cupin domain-containing protein [Cytobacillus sp. IB215316]|uniref:cupin domain-containing protein n=1 Tax=Cytobacillus sp. IB215316 TaxID=3097354 RepID=UPI002A16B428|nr:cupin domain-containing protein [Cytobacillus sp. IB215316]MDX8360813.1 cupin domain-containing protein [Cytobacillus sp. IB215316]